MRILVALAASLLFAGCPSSPNPIPAQPTPASSPNPIPAQPTPASSPSPIPAQPKPAATPFVSPETTELPGTSSQATYAAPNVTQEWADTASRIIPESAEVTPDASSEPTSTKISYEGLWTTADAQGQAFDIIIFPNGQAVTNWTKGTEGARGERGYWRQDEQRITVVYSDGSTDVIERGDNGFQHRRYSAGSPLDSQPLAQGEAKRGEGNDSSLVGVWRLNKEPDGSHLYIALQSNGRAMSTINGGTEGKWKANEKGALCEWPDGWVDQIERGNAGWQKRSWIGSESSAPADLSLATRVGETRFLVEP
jgi:hypothetical protein